mmetsp:Transcript_22687/g.19706  ORF Transcript_22687/g.19706 Transcript_22687/m.19706 type:complete len:175 (+) Transcript_22687:78-602(+)
MTKAIIVSLLLVAACSAVNLRPIFGILTSPSTFEGHDDPANQAYINGAFNQIIEAGGCRTAPVAWDMDTNDLNTLLGYLNGIAISTNFYDQWSEDVLNRYKAVISTILGVAKSQTDSGNPFPVFVMGDGIPLALNYFLSDNLLSSFDASGATTLSIVSTSDTFRLLTDDVVSEI